VTLVRKDISEERIASILRVTRIRGLGKMLAVTSNPITMYVVFLRSVLRLLVTASVGPRSPILLILLNVGSEKSHTA
jgi:hypothetical protein